MCTRYVEIFSRAHNTLSRHTINLNLLGGCNLYKIYNITTLSNCKICIYNHPENSNCNPSLDFIYMLIRANDVNEHSIFPKFSVQPTSPLKEFWIRACSRYMYKLCFACPKYTTVFLPCALNPCFTPVLISS